MSAAGGIAVALPWVFAGVVIVTAGVVWAFVVAGRARPVDGDASSQAEAGWRPHLIEAGVGGLDRLFDGIAPRAVEPAHGWTAADEAAAEADWKAVSGKPFEVAGDEAAAEAVDHRYGAGDAEFPL